MAGAGDAWRSLPTPPVPFQLEDPLLWGPESFCLSDRARGPTKVWSLPRPLGLVLFAWGQFLGGRKDTFGSEGRLMEKRDLLRGSRCWTSSYLQWLLSPALLLTCQSWRLMPHQLRPMWPSAFEHHQQRRWAPELSVAGPPCLAPLSGQPAVVILIVFRMAWSKTRQQWAQWICGNFSCYWPPHFPSSRSHLLQYWKGKVQGIMASSLLASELLAESSPSLTSL